MRYETYEQEQAKLKKEYEEFFKGNGTINIPLN